MKPMDHLPPFLQLSIGLISIDARARVESVSSVCETLAELHSKQASAQRKPLLHVKGSGIPSHFLLSNLSILSASFLHYAYDFSITYRTARSFVYNFQLHTLAFYVFSFQTPQESESHQNQADTQFAKSCSDRRSGVHGISARLTASAETAAKTIFPPFVTVAIDARLQFFLHSTMEASLSLHEARQEVWLFVPSYSIYVNSDIKSSSKVAGRRERRGTTGSTQCVRVERSQEMLTFARTAYFPRRVMRNCPAHCGKAIYAMTADISAVKNKVILKEYL